MADTSNYCGNCKKAISNNFELHKAHCERHITLCKICQESVPRLELDDHLKQEHCLQNCSECDLPFEKCKLELHKVQCIKRSVVCTYCENVFPFDSISLHEYECGSKTEKCSSCSNYILRKNLKQHCKTCLNQSKPNVQKMCTYCNLSYPEHIFHEHVDACSSRTEKCSTCQKLIMLRDLSQHLSNCPKEQCIKQAVVCVYCDNVFPFDSISLHEYECGSKTEKCPSCNNYILRKNIKQHFKTCLNQSKPNVQKMCTYCNLSHPEYIFHEHVDACSSRTEKCSTCQKLIMLRDLSQHLSNCPKQCKLTVQKMCTYCNLLYPENMFHEHVDACSSQTEKCSTCGKLIMLRDLSQHLSNCPKINSPFFNFCKKCGADVGFMDMGLHEKSCCVKGEFSSFKSNMEWEMTANKGAMNSTDTDNDVFCHLCKQNVPHETYSSHEKMCKKDYYVCALCLEVVSILNTKNHELYTCKSIKKSHFEMQLDPVSSSSALTAQNNNVENNDLKCPYCENNMASCEFEEHLPVCSKKLNVSRKEENKYRSIAKTESDFDGACAAPASQNKYYSEFEESMECPYCKCKIMAHKYTEHLSTCSEDEKICRFCESKISVMDEESHIRCCSALALQNKNKSVQNRESRHKTNLKEDSMPCPFCQSKIIFHKYTEHLTLCSEKSKLCQFCKKKILLVDEEEHIKRCPAVNGEKTNCTKNKKNRKGTKVHYQQNSSVSLTCSFCSEKFRKEDFADHYELCSDDKKKHKNNENGLKGGFSKIFTSLFPSNKDTREQPENTAYNSRHLQTRRSETHQVIKLPCEFCDELFPEYELIVHQSGCRPDLVSFSRSSGEHDPERKFENPHTTKERVDLLEGNYWNRSSPPSALPKNSKVTQPGEFLEYYSYTCPEAERRNESHQQPHHENSEFTNRNTRNIRSEFAYNEKLEFVDEKNCRKENSSDTNENCSDSTDAQRKQRIFSFDSKTGVEKFDGDKDCRAGIRNISKTAENYHDIFQPCSEETSVLSIARHKSTDDQCESTMKFAAETFQFGIKHRNMITSHATSGSNSPVSLRSQSVQHSSSNCKDDVNSYSESYYEFKQIGSDSHKETYVDCESCRYVKNASGQNHLAERCGGARPKNYLLQTENRDTSSSGQQVRSYKHQKENDRCVDSASQTSFSRKSSVKGCRELSSDSD